MSFDPESQQVVGWDSIWAIIEVEENDKKAFEDKLQAGIGAYANK